AHARHLTAVTFGDAIERRVAPERRKPMRGSQPRDRALHRRDAGISASLFFRRRIGWHDADEDAADRRNLRSAGARREHFHRVLAALLEPHGSAHATSFGRNGLLV